MTPTHRLQMERKATPRTVGRQPKTSYLTDTALSEMRPWNRSRCRASSRINGAGECNAHHATLGDSNSKPQALSIDTGTSGLTTESVKSRKDWYLQWLVDRS